MKTESMKDLQEQIREKAKAYSDSVIEDEFNPLRKYTIDDLMEEMECAFEQGANFILSKWEESERWRKVEEELPEFEANEYPKGNYKRYLVKVISGSISPKEIITIGWLINNRKWNVEYDWVQVIEWKPIK